MRNCILSMCAVAIVAVAALWLVDAPSAPRTYAQAIQEVHPLRDAHIVQRHGSLDATGVCRMPPFRFDAHVGDGPIEARQLDIDLKSCVETVQIGTPVDVATEESGGSSKSAPATEAQQKGRAGSSSSQGSVTPLVSTDYIEMHVWWEDVLNIDVNKTYSRMSFAYDGGCVVGSDGSGYWWWAGTGWSLTSSSAYINRIPYGWCVPTQDNPNRSRYAQTLVSGAFKNGIFCAGFDTRVYYTNVWTYATFNGSVSGSFDDTWVDEPSGCPPLHWRAQFVP